MKTHPFVLENNPRALKIVKVKDILKRFEVKNCKINSDVGTNLFVNL